MSLPNPAERPAGLGIVLLTVFIDMVAFAIILPALPFHAMALGATGVWLGVLLTAYSGAKLVGATVVGRLSDRLGRKPLLIICLAGSGLSFLLTGLAGSLLMLAAARAVAGLFGGTVAIAQAYVADTTEPAQRARYMGLVGAAVGTGFIVGPGIGAALSREGFETATLIAAALAFGNAVLATLAVRESPSRPAPSAAFEGLRAALVSPTTVRILAGVFLTLFAFVSMETTLAFVARDSYGITERGFGMILVYVGVIMIVVQGALVGRLAPRYGERTLAALGALLLGTAMVLLPLAPGFGVMMGVLGLLALGQGLASPTLSTLLSRHSVRRDQGGVLGIGQSVASAARALAPVTAGFLYDVGISWPFLVAGSLALIASLVVVRLPGTAAEQPAVGAR